MVKPLTWFGWFIIETLYGVKDPEGTLRAGMEQTLAAIDAAVTAHAPSRGTTGK